jgi:carbamoyl-phosphate synthase large subunit
MLPTSSSSSSSSVIIPGASGPAGINTIKSLKMVNFRGKIIATDSSTLSAGFFMADSSEVLPEANHSAYIDRLIEIIKNHEVKVLMPASGFDIYPYSENRERLAEIGAYAVVSDRNTLEMCRDKTLTYQSLSSNGSFKVPFTTTNPDKVKSFPVIAKPQFGKGSRDVLKIDDESGLEYISSKFDSMIFQEFLPGTEYTIDVLSDLDKKPLMAVPRIRIQTKAGISTKGKVMRDADIEINCMKIAEHLGIRGPCCIQMKESSEGIIKLIEVNPRLGGGTIFTALAGANFPAMILDMVNGKEISNLPNISEITVIRYFEEIVIRNEERLSNEAAAESNVLSKMYSLG